ncbi:hypothetical protein [Companilactobacillus mishanensis]|uniref:Uncharacterized protein n=1 Tax=Companilactobacillus mishanensis TaxID=2486008 RepID=A0A5P0ZF76_9LACO|nr:hypothetical protein [Companilactobacillus mishanensis]MQS44262.1 hypothetical protein [Companilactobacillus mishanensis]MQS51635.1 hypothetical protein [Companilactobacillus mishanensis]
MRIIDGYTPEIREELSNFIYHNYPITGFMNDDFRKEYPEITALLYNCSTDQELMLMQDIHDLFNKSAELPQKYFRWRLKGNFMENQYLCRDKIEGIILKKYEPRHCTDYQFTESELVEQAIKIPPFNMSFLEKVGVDDDD